MKNIENIQNRNIQNSKSIGISFFKIKNITCLFVLRTFKVKSVHLTYTIFVSFP